MPAQKKHQSVRRRTNTASSAAVLQRRDDGEVIEVPAMPPRYLTVITDGVVTRTEIEWLPETVEWWGDVWASPMSDEYLDADVHGLIRLAVLVDNYWYSPNAKTHAEVRLAQKDYGLTPYDRRRLEWTIEGVRKAKAGATALAAPAPGALQPDPAADPRLTLVK